MKPEEQRIAIAEACGYRNIALREDPDEGFDPLLTGFKNDNHFDEQIPDYLNSLNAMWEAEKALLISSFMWETYSEILAAISDCNEYEPFAATATQRAKALLKTIGKWEGNKV